MRCALILALAFGAIASQALPQKTTAKRKISLQHPEIAATCYWTHGRLAVYNKNPTWRIWKIGTNRLLAILSGPSSQRHDVEDSLHPEFPANLEGIYQADYKGRVARKEWDAEFPESAYESVILACSTDFSQVL